MTYDCPTCRNLVVCEDGSEPVPCAVCTGAAVEYKHRPERKPGPYLALPGAIWMPLPAEDLAVFKDEWRRQFIGPGVRWSYPVIKEQTCFSDSPLYADYFEGMTPEQIREAHEVRPLTRDMMSRTSHASGRNR